MARHPSGDAPLRAGPPLTTGCGDDHDAVVAAGEGAIGPENICAEIGEVITGAKPGRNSPAEITIFKSLGLAVEDLDPDQRFLEFEV